MSMARNGLNDMRRHELVGKIYPTSKSGEIEITEYKDANSVTIRFLRTGNLKVVRMGNVLSGRVTDRGYEYQTPSVCGIGVVGVGAYSSRTHRLIYKAWCSMLRRCYSDKVQMRQPSYIGCSVCDEWLNFQNFAQWFESQKHSADCQVDKDLLVRGNKVYSPDTCALIPEEVNKIIISQPRGEAGLPIGVFLIKKNVGTNKPAFGAHCQGFGKSRGHIGQYYTAEEAFNAYKKAKATVLEKAAFKHRNILEPRVFQALRKYSFELKQ